MEPFAQYGLLGLVLFAVGAGAWKIAGALVMVLREGFAKLEAGMKEMGGSHAESVKQVGSEYGVAIQSILTDWRVDREVDRAARERQARELQRLTNTMAGAGIRIPVEADPPVAGPVRSTGLVGE